MCLQCEAAQARAINSDSRFRDSTPQQGIDGFVDVSRIQTTKLSAAAQAVTRTQ
jgi:hypothetical protein